MSVFLLFSDICGNLKVEEVFEEKFNQKSFYFDGSSIEGGVRRYESDMKLVPDMDSQFKINGSPAYFCDVFQNNKEFHGDPRTVLKMYLKNLKYGVKTAAELEFYLIKKDGEPIDNASYWDVSPKDNSEKIKEETLLQLKNAGIVWDSCHHECGPGQNEIDLKYDNPLASCDKILLAKNIIKRVASKHDAKATFMPKPFSDKPGNGMHIHISLWEDAKNLFYDTNDEYNLSQIAKHFIGGVLRHAKAIAAVTNPTINSYKRLGEFEAPRLIYWGRKNRDALIRIPEANAEESRRIEFRLPDPSCNTYLALLVTLASGIDGINNRIEPPHPIERDVVPEDCFEAVPNSLEEALTALERDEVIRNSLEGVYTPFVKLKKKEIKEYNSKVTNVEWLMYEDV